MNKKLFFISTLILSAFIFMSCSNLLGDNNSKETAISLALPYGKASSARAADSEKISYNFKVTFKHETEPEKIIEAKSGESITYEEAPTGKYTITVKGQGPNGEVVEGSAEATVSEGQTTTVNIKLYRTDVIEINALSHTDELSKMLEMYITMHPDCGLVVNYKEKDAKTGEYTPYLDSALTGHPTDGFIPDIWGSEAAFVMRYTRGAMGGYALPYDELIPDLNKKISDAEIAPYTVDIGKNKSNEIVGLAYQSTGGAFIYNRSVAKTVLGTDDPDTVAEALGKGSESWDKFREVAKLCKAKGVAIVSGDGDIWHPMEDSADEGWVVDGKLHIDPKRAAFFDFAKELTDEGYSNDTQDWTQEWYDDMAEIGPKPVLGFFGPAWLINYVMAGCAGDTYGDWAVCESPVSFTWGGTWIQVNKTVADANPAKKEAIAKFLEWATLDTTEDGFLYNWANGCFSNEKDTVSSAVVMKNADGKLDYLGGQDMFKCYIPANNNIKKIVRTEYDEVIDNIWREQARLYADGILSKTQALLNFIYSVKVEFGFEYDGYTSATFYQSEHVKAEPDPDGNGVKFTITAKPGEKWNQDTLIIKERNNNLYLQIRENYPTSEGDNNTVVCYWPFTDDGKGYVFDCDFRFADGLDDVIRETVYSIAKGGSAKVSVNSEAIKGFAPEMNVETGIVKLNKDITSAVSYSNNITPSWDFGAFTNSKNEPDSYDWKQWLNTTFTDFAESKLLGSGEGVQLLKYNYENVQKLREDGYCFVNLQLRFKVDKITEFYIYDNSFLSDIYDPSEAILKLNSNGHISVQPDEKGVKITLTRLASDDNWTDWTDIKCSDSNGKLVAKINTRPHKTADDGSELTFDFGNGLPESVDATKDYYYPFTENGKYYDFVFEGSVKDGEWISEFVTCKAGGGIGELNYSVWENNVKAENFNSSDHSFKINASDLTGLLNDPTKIQKMAFAVDVGYGWPDEEGSEWLANMGKPYKVFGEFAGDWPEYSNLITSASASANTFTITNTEDLNKIQAHENKFHAILYLRHIQISGYDGIEYELMEKKYKN